MRGLLTTLGTLTQTSAFYGLFSPSHPEAKQQQELDICLDPFFQRILTGCPYAHAALLRRS